MGLFSELDIIHWLDTKRKAEEAALTSDCEKRRARLPLPKRMIPVLRCFEEALSERVWEWVKVLLVGAILAPGERRVTAILRVMGLQNERPFPNAHRVLKRATWSRRALSRLLLHLLLPLVVPADAPSVVGIDETIERRRGAKRAAKGMDRDPVRSSQAFFVKSRGLRWISMLLLVPVPWACRVWALPFFTVRAPCERSNQQHRRRHQKRTDWGRHMIGQLRRWLPLRRLGVVAERSDAVLEWLACAARMSEPVAVITRLRQDAALDDPAPVRQPGTNGRPRLKGARQPTQAKRLADRATVWQKLTVAWSGGTTRQSHGRVRLPCGITMLCHQSRSGGFGFVTRRGSLISRRFCGPISSLRLRLFGSGLSCDGRGK
ncbi:MAG TPA: transposase [Ktedonobacteraceae bacterium]